LPVISFAIFTIALNATMIKSAVRIMTPSMSRLLSRSAVNSSIDTFCHMARAQRHRAPVLIPPTTAAVFLRNFNKEKINSLACRQDRYR